jgi:hypothetical protein
MKIFISYYQNPFIGNCSTDILHIPNNKILVSQLKELIFEKYRIHQSQQRLTTKIADLTLVLLTLILGNNDK